MLETDRLVLRPMRSDDFDALLAIFTDPRVMASFGGLLFDHQQMAWWLQRNLDHQEQHGYGLFAVIHKQHNRLIGNCGLERTQLNQLPTTELGYDFRSDYWKQGLATEAARAVRDYAWRDLDLPELVSFIRQGNLASRRVAEKIGMHEHTTLQKGEIAYWVYRIVRPGDGEADDHPNPTGAAKPAPHAGDGTAQA